MFKQRKKTIVLLILTTMIATSAMPVAASVIREAGEKAELILGLKPERIEQAAPNDRISPIEPVVLKTEGTGAGEDEQVVYQGSRDSLEKEPQDRYSMTTEQMEKYIDDGFTIADLYEADALANQWLIAPDQLLKHRKVEGNWEKGLQSAQTENAQLIVEGVYKPKYPKEFAELSKEKLNPETQLQLFAYYDRDQSAPMKNLINLYRKSPETFKQNHKKMLSDTASRVTEMHLSKPTTSGKQSTKDVSQVELSEREQQSMQELAEKTGIPADKLTQKYQSFLEGARK
ncbi:hypothetical protein [Cohnella lupini]|uniref:Uncharacterized protein n=1 Tax=Cohnella lupini TaxID=1294267 RepID=A0A3D9HZ09_9BACL|nr:hypothetical protein [Cohnella lupini]RED54737.1 hypothetical protein DFP95_12262 [Cohnella lupini]